MKGSSITAPILRIILIIGLVLLITVGAGGFLLVRNMLVKKSDETAKISADAATSDNKLQSIKDAENTLNQNAIIEAKARQMVSESKSYQYQDQIILDILKIGNAADVKITEITFEEPLGTKAAPTTGAAGAATTVPQAIVGGIKQTTASITIKNPIRYDKWLAFVHYIEQNVMKMQIAKVSVSSTGQYEASHSLISSDNFTIGVYIR